MRKVTLSPKAPFSFSSVFGTMSGPYFEMSVYVAEAFSSPSVNAYFNTLRVQGKSLACFL